MLPYNVDSITWLIDRHFSPQVSSAVYFALTPVASPCRPSNGLHKLLPQKGTHVTDSCTEPEAWLSNAVLASPQLNPKNDCLPRSEHSCTIKPPTRFICSSNPLLPDFISSQSKPFSACVNSTDEFQNSDWLWWYLPTFAVASAPGHPTTGPNL